MTTRPIAFLAFCLFLATTGHAQKATVTDGRQTAEKEASDWKAGLEELKRTDPKEFEATKKSMIVVAEMGLARLGYDPGPFDGVLDERTIAALKKYEQSRQLKMTGDPTDFATISQLKTDIDALDAQPVFLPRYVFGADAWDRGWVFAEGTWALLNDNSGLPEQATKIDCDRAIMRCTDTVASLYRPGTGSPHLSLDTTWYDIERWDEHEVVTKPSESLLGCTRTVLRLNRLQRSASLIRTTISKDGLCDTVSVGDLNAKLVDGSTVWQPLYDAWQKKISELIVLSPEAREALGKRD